MSRPIKFRAFFLGKMVDVFAVNPMNQTLYLSRLQVTGELGDDLLVSYRQDEGDAPNAHLMQYTGLKDMNGVEIYEGDIIARRANKSVPVEAAVSTYTVRWTQTAARTGFNVASPNGQQARTLEVIGNIYENLELLK